MKFIKIRDYILLAAIVAWLFYVIKIGPAEIVDKMGSQNSFIVIVITTFFGAVTAVPIATVYPTVITFAAGGLHPIITGLAAALGITIANIIFFYLGNKGQELAKNSTFFSKYQKRILNWIAKQPEWAIPFFIFIFIGLTPLPNNVLTASGGLANYPFKKMLAPLVIGNVFLMLVIAYIASSQAPGP